MTKQTLGCKLCLIKCQIFKKIQLSKQHFLKHFICNFLEHKSCIAICSNNDGAFLFCRGRRGLVRSEPSPLIFSLPSPLHGGRPCGLGWSWGAWKYSGIQKWPQPEWLASYHLTGISIPDSVTTCALTLYGLVCTIAQAV